MPGLNVTKPEVLRGNDAEAMAERRKTMMM
jgi:hypothetical protein